MKERMNGIKIFISFKKTFITTTMTWCVMFLTITTTSTLFYFVLIFFNFYFNIKNINNNITLHYSQLY